jgi:uncharacterized protein (TIGR00369 family)
MSEVNLVEHLNSKRVQFLDDLGCEIESVDPEAMECRMRFGISARYCHSGDIIQGGFVAAMLDAVSTHALFAANTRIAVVATLEMKVNYLEASRMGTLNARGRVVKMTKSVAFLEAELRDSEDRVTATMTATAKIRLA